MIYKDSKMIHRKDQRRDKKQCFNIHSPLTISPPQSVSQSKAQNSPTLCTRLAFLSHTAWTQKTPALPSRRVTDHPAIAGQIL